MTAGPEESIRLANAVRSISALLVGGHLSPETVTALAEALEDAVPEGAPVIPAPPSMEVDWDDPINERFYNGPGVGRANPLSPPVLYDFRPPATVGVARVRFGAAHAGSHGFVHGGWVAHVFDEILGGTQTAAGHGGMTGTLTIRYRKPTPTDRELALRAEVTAREGRKATVVATLHDGDELLADADAVFVRPTWRERGPLA